MIVSCRIRSNASKHTIMIFFFSSSKVTSAMVPVRGNPEGGDLLWKLRRCAAFRRNEMKDGNTHSTMLLIQSQGRMKDKYIS